MDTTVIIPQYGQPELTARCVASLRQHETARWPVLIVDDGSPPADRCLRRAARDNSERFVSVRHRGVTAAWNIGCRLAETEFVVLVNNDVLWQGPALAELRQSLSRGGGTIAGVGWRTERECPAAFASEVQHPAFVEGWCWGFARETWRRLGGFDESLRLYFSDTDFQYRAGRELQGERVVSRVPLHHAGHRSTRLLGDRRRQWRRDRQRFLEKWS